MGNACNGDRGKHVEYSKFERLEVPRALHVAESEVTDISIDDLAYWVAVEWPWAAHDMNAIAIDAEISEPEQAIPSVAAALGRFSADELMDFRRIVYAAAHGRKYRILDSLFSELDVSRSGALNAYMIVDKMNRLLKYSSSPDSLPASVSSNGSGMVASASSQSSMNGTNSIAASSSTQSVQSSKSNASKSNPVKVDDGREALTEDGARVVRHSMETYSKAAQQKGCGDIILRDEFHRAFSYWSLNEIHAFTRPSRCLSRAELMQILNPELDMKEMQRQMDKKAKEAADEDVSNLPAIGGPSNIKKVPSETRVQS